MMRKGIKNRQIMSIAKLELEKHLKAQLLFEVNAF